MKYAILILTLLGMFLTGCLEDGVSSLAPSVDELNPSSSWLVVNPDSLDTEEGVDTVFVKVAYLKPDGKGSVLENILRMEEVDLQLADSIRWLNADSLDATRAMLEVRGKAGDELVAQFFSMEDNDCLPDTLRLTIVEKGAKINCPPMIDFTIDPASGFAPFTTTITPDIFDADGDSVSAMLDVGFDTLAVTHGQPVQVTFVGIGTHDVRLIVDDGNENGRVELSKNVFVQELPATKLLVKSSSLDSVQVQVSGQSSHLVLTDTVLVLDAGGDYQLIASKSGYVTDTLTTNVIANSNSSVDISLQRVGQPDTTFLAIDSDPLDVNVRIYDPYGDFDTTTVAPVVVALPNGGAYKIDANKVNYQPKTINVYAAAGQLSNARIELDSVVVLDPPSATLVATADTVMQGEVYGLLYTAVNVESALLDGQNVNLPTGSRQVIATQPGSIVHELVAHGYDGTQVIVRARVIVLEQIQFVPDILVDPLTIDFGQVTLGANMPKEYVTIANVGTADLEVSSITLTGLDADKFKLANVSGGILEPGEDHRIKVSFCPETLGTKQAEIKILSNDPDEPVVVVSLTGEGVQSKSNKQSAGELTALTK